MALRLPQLDSLRNGLAELRTSLPSQVLHVVDRWEGDATALRYHLDRQRERHPHPALVAVLGGTGTGKSTLVNRLLEANVTATSFRRTFTSGAVAIAADAKNLPREWLSIEHRVVSDVEIPARGQVDALAVVKEERELTKKITLVDTP